ncbi:MAG: energy transducer TonB [Methylococcales bacterium]|nr:energy transducer TonB [Methylococcales bacterium]
MERCRVKRSKLVILIIAFCVAGCQGTIDKKLFAYEVDKKFFPYNIESKPYNRVVENKRVFLAPFQLFTKKTEKNNQHDQLFLAIKKYLEKNGYEVLSPENFILAWNINRLFVGSLYDQQSGEISPVRLKECLSKTLIDLKTKNNFSAIIIPKLSYKDFDLKEKLIQTTTWNGVERQIRLDDAQYNYSKSLATVSLNMFVFSNDFSPVFESKGGLNFMPLNKAKTDSSNRKDKKIKYFSEEHIAEAIEVAFYPFINSALVEETMPESYIKMVKRKLSMNLEYPKTERNKNIEGEVIVRFTINSEGKANNLIIVESSGNKVLDEEALKTIKKSSRFPKPPARFFIEDIVVEIPLKFEKRISLAD